ncbi:hypothetical protein Dsin_005689 [Dipteronia sinensis]|uniref:Uncharacterized protein n=1 Tax=Dipteronia sinensis TaxID=43782 RepID=A0AAE0AXB3_9ROSI|nr:hypothetical protein Dsin_005689 [Dipteronia sinensis]
MGPLQPESNPNISVMEPQQHPTAKTSTDHQLSAPKLSSSSSSSSSSLHTDEIRTTPNKRCKDSHDLASNSGDEEFLVCSMPRHEQSSGEFGSTAQSPPMQVMERTDDFADVDPNRIPAHLFDRSKSSAPVEWSTCSNESLFSIHMGNMSFTRDHVNWIGKSGELVYIGEYQSSSMPPIDFSSNQPPSSQSAEFAKKRGNLNQWLGATEAAAAETMREVIRENAASEQNNHSPDKLSPRKIEIRPSSHRHHSDESIKSFAFPILTGDVDQSESVSVGKEKRNKQAASQPQTPKTTPQSEPQTPKSETAKEGQNGGQIRWLACFSCCPFCS